MKGIKTKVSFFVAMVMVMTAFFSVFTPNTQKVYAQENYSLTIKNDGKTEHKFNVYQIFKGDLAEVDGEDVLSNIEWGKSIKESSKGTLGNASQKAESLANNEEKAKQFAEEIQGDLTNPVAENEVVQAGDKLVLNNLEPGYYLVKDAEGSQADKPNGAYTLYILQVVKNTEVKTKLDVPSVEKKVKDINESESETKTDWQDSADYDIGDEIPYQLKGTLPSNYDQYKTYKYEFVDTMSKGLTYNNNAKVYVVNGDSKEDITNQAVISTTSLKDESTVLSVKFDDLKKITEINSNSKIVVEYTANLNKSAVVGSLGNPNDVYLKYSNNPNNDGSGDVGETPKDKNIVFTYKVIVNKVNENNMPLAGAEFTLFKKLKNGQEKPVDTLVINEPADNPTTFNFSGLDDGTYILRETKVPAGYNKIPDQTFKIVADHDIDSQDPKLKDLKAETIDGGTITFTPNTDEGSLTTNVVNKKGIVLPSTGGMGTYLIYGLGVAFVSVAGLTLVLKRCKKC
ncbi:TPA: isopeptide-forming domain-containing fimbrial protein [Clostridium perfringens]|nr:isopeptide-forming domain-containing fimbrial protein [Clostridium perfringens]